MSYSDALYKHWVPFRAIAPLIGYTQAKNTQASLAAQIDYEQYLRSGNERALADWHKGFPGKKIQYPEFSYPGQIRRADTSIARAGFDYNTADANYVAIETIKDGLVYDARYRTVVRDIHGVKVLVTCNVCPKLDKLSRDRWRLFDAEGAPLS